MHGRKKTGIEPTEEEAAAVSSKVQAYKKLAAKLLDARNAITNDPSNAIKQLSVDMLPLQAQLLKVNPDFYSMWNHRKELLLAQQFQELSNEGSIDNSFDMKQVIKSQNKPPHPFSQKILQNELYLTSSCIKKQPKSYGAWHHRLWVIQGHVEAQAKSNEQDTQQQVASASSSSSSSSSSGSSREILKTLLQGEIDLCAQFLEADQRNFHCWAYRHYITQNAQVSDDDEMDFTMQKIEQNFSNYSAFHYRSKILEKCLARVKDKQKDEGANEDREDVVILVKGLNSVDLLRSELEMVCQAAFTEPEDQSAWWYHRFLLDWGARALCDRNNQVDQYIELLKNEVEQLRELRDSDSSYKWAHISLANSIDCLSKYIKDETELNKLKEEYTTELNFLVTLDPSRSGYYTSLLATS